MKRICKFSTLILVSALLVSSSFAQGKAKGKVAPKAKPAPVKPEKKFSPKDPPVKGEKGAIIVNGKAYSKASEVLVKGGSTKGAAVEHGDSSLLDDVPNVDSFYIGRYEVTQEFYEAVLAGETVSTKSGKNFELDAKPSSSLEKSLVKGETQKYRPVENVTWYDAVNFCNVLSKKTGLEPVYTIEINKIEETKVGNYIEKHIMDATVSINKKANGYRLPSEPEWEFAARGGDASAPDWSFAFSGSQSKTYKKTDMSSPDLDKVAWYVYNLTTGKTGKEKVAKDTPGYCTHEVGLKAANKLGLYDMSGNVYEWCYDLGEDDGERIVRGGNYCSSARAATVTAWDDAPMTQHHSGVGFRVARNAK